MAEEAIETTEQTEEPTDDFSPEEIWSELFGDEEDDNELSPDIQAVADDAEEKAEREDAKSDLSAKKVAQKLVAHIAEEKSMKAYNDAIAGMDDLERDIALTLLRPGDEPGTITKKVGLVKAQAQKVRELAEKHIAEKESEAEERAAAAWNITTGTRPAPRDEEQEKELREAAVRGNPMAAFEFVLGAENRPKRR